MFLFLTKYLLQFKKVAIPHIGRLQLVAEPAALDIADKIMHPPLYTVQFADKDDADQHQLQYIAAASKTDEATVAEQLNSFGAALRHQIQQQPFTWNGIGQWRHENGTILFDSATIAVPALQSLEAHRVLREHSSHTVLIGDREVHSHKARERYTTDEHKLAPATANKKKVAIIIALVIAVAAIAFIGYYLYTNNFQPSASGYRQKISPAAPSPTYH